MIIVKEFLNDLDKLGVELAPSETLSTTLNTLESVLNMVSINTSLEVLPIEGANRLVVTENTGKVNNWYIICEVVYKKQSNEITLEQLESMLLGETVNGLKMSKEVLEFYTEHMIYEIDIHEFNTLCKGETIQPFNVKFNSQVMSDINDITNMIIKARKTIK